MLEKDIQEFIEDLEKDIANDEKIYYLDELSILLKQLKDPKINLVYSLSSRLQNLIQRILEDKDYHSYSSQETLLSLFFRIKEIIIDSDSNQALLGITSKLGNFLLGFIAKEIIQNHQNLFFLNLDHFNEILLYLNLSKEDDKYKLYYSTAFQLEKGDSLDEVYRSFEDSPYLDDIKLFTNQDVRSSLRPFEELSEKAFPFIPKLILQRQLIDFNDKNSIISWLKRMVPFRKHLKSVNFNRLFIILLKSLILMDPKEKIIIDIIDIIDHEYLNSECTDTIVIGLKIISDIKDSIQITLDNSTLTNRIEKIDINSINKLSITQLSRFAINYDYVLDYTHNILSEEPLTKNTITFARKFFEFLSDSGRKLLLVKNSKLLVGIIQKGIKLIYSGFIIQIQRDLALKHQRVNNIDEFMNLMNYIEVSHQCHLIKSDLNSVSVLSALFKIVFEFVEYQIDCNHYKIEYTKIIGKKLEQVLPDGMVSFDKFIIHSAPELSRYMMMNFEYSKVFLDIFLEIKDTESQRNQLAKYISHLGDYKNQFKLILKKVHHISPTDHQAIDHIIQSTSTYPDTSFILNILLKYISPNLLFQSQVFRNRFIVQCKTIKDLFEVDKLISNNNTNISSNNITHPQLPKIVLKIIISMVFSSPPSIKSDTVSRVMSIAYTCKQFFQISQELLSNQFFKHIFLKSSRGNSDKCLFTQIPVNINIDNIRFINMKTDSFNHITSINLVPQYDTNDQIYKLFEKKLPNLTQLTVYNIHAISNLKPFLMNHAKSLQYLFIQGYPFSIPREYISEILKNKNEFSNLVSLTVQAPYERGMEFLRKYIINNANPNHKIIDSSTIHIQFNELIHNEILEIIKLIYTS